MGELLEHGRVYGRVYAESVQHSEYFLASGQTQDLSLRAVVGN